jgi:glycosyltransferase involved in cell wall biosynthesis
LPTLHLIDPLIRRRSGHNYQFALNLRRVALERGWQCRVYVPRAIESEAVVTDLAAIRALDHASQPCFADPQVDIGGANYRFYEDVMRIAEGGAGPEDLLFVAMLQHRNMFGLMRALDELKAEGRRPRLSALLWSQQCFVEPGGEIHGRNSGFYRQFLEWCAANRQECWPIWAFSAAHMEHLSTLGGGAAGVVPVRWIMSTLPGAELPPRPAGDGFRFGYFGYSVLPDKGLAQWLEAAETIAARLPDSRFTVQIETRDATYDVDSILARHQGFLAAPEVTVLRGDLDAPSYFAALAACDVVVLPYGPMYRRQESGILHEASSLGKPVVAPVQSIAHSRLLAAGIAIPGFAEWTAESIADACLAARRDHDRLAALVRQHAATLNRGTSCYDLADDMGIHAEAR